MRRVLVLAAFLALAAPHVRPADLSCSLKRMYDAAPSMCGYDKYVRLETGVTYTGGLFIGRTFNRITAVFEGNEARNVRIAGNGAILDLQGQEICIAYCNNRLDIENCVVINGAVRFRGYTSPTETERPTGSVRHVTFYAPHDYAVRTIGCGTNILIERNIAIDAVDTGSDFIYVTGYASEWLPTGTNFAFSQSAGMPGLYDNWSFHSDPAKNAAPLRHFGVICEYG